MPVVVFYVSVHGLGHVSRCAEVVNALRDQQPDAHVVLLSDAPAWFIDSAIHSPIDRERVAPDTGIVQIDSLRIDEEETARSAARFYSRFAERVEREAARLTQLGASVVVGDAPPLAFAAADAAHVPSILLANFTWDWIYAAYDTFERLAPGVIACIRDAYAQADSALRLPLWDGFTSVRAPIRDIPLIARRSRLGRDQARAQLAIDTRGPVVLASFGRYGLHVPYEQIIQRDDLTIIVGKDVDGTSRGAEDMLGARGRLIGLSATDLAQRGLRYEDLVAAADVVVSKPGYGIVSECAANDTALLYARRGSFIEQELLIREMPRVVRARAIAIDRLLDGDWRDDIDAVLMQPRPHSPPDVNGAEVAAHAIAALYT